MRHAKLKNIMLIPLFSALLAISAQLQIPFVVPFTLQLLSIYIALMILGGIAGGVSVFIYICLGLIGLPVFSGFGSGCGFLFSAAGGYIIGFIPLCLTYTALCAIFGSEGKRPLIFSLVSLAPLYLTAILWLTFVYTDATGGSFITSLTLFVAPFIIPDLIKCVLAYFISKRIKKALGSGQAS